MQGGQHLAALRILAIGIVRPRRRQHLAPAGDGDLLAHGRQRLTAARELRHRAVELMVWEELREVMGADQPVDGQLLLAHGRQVGGFQRRDDAVVSRHLAVVPCTRAQLAIQALDQRPQAGVGLDQAVEYGRHLSQHALGQVARIRARIRGGLVRLVQRLGDVQRLLHVEAQLLGAHLLQRAQVERQRRPFANALGFYRQHLGGAGRAQALGGLLRHRLLQAAARIVGAALRRRPACDEGLACMR
ncbi:hypothetical protein SDC9_149226 [bioreactor metagenome]|uniref:Uncharacterized protein n=1 Tax=bioreactor metagenome TaxID=1076179 RepID=A0A645EN93_9ZZZZ